MATATSSLATSYRSMMNPVRFARLRQNMKTRFAAQHITAAELEAMSGGLLTVSFDPTATYRSEKRYFCKGRLVDPSAGHIYEAHLYSECDYESLTGNLMSADDRRGNVQQQLAAELRRVAGVYLRLAEIYEVNDCSGPACERTPPLALTG